MTLNQLNGLTDEELGMALVVGNHISPIESPKMTFEPRHLTWFKHDTLIKKFLDVFPRLKPAGHATYVSLMQKLRVCIRIKQNPNEPPRAENNGSNPCSPTSGIQPDVLPVTGSNAEGKQP